MTQEKEPSNYSWVSLIGKFDEEDDGIVFRGYDYLPEKAPNIGVEGGSTPEPPQPRGGVGRAVCNQRLTDGKVSVDIEFADVDPLTTAEVILHHDPVTDEMLTVGFGANGLLVNVRHWTTLSDKVPQRTGLASEKAPHWNIIRSSGDRGMIKAGRSLHLEIRVQGSSLAVEVDGVEIGSTALPFQLSGKQVGLFCQSRFNIHFRTFRVESTMPLAFVVMQFEPPEYEELFNDVIVPVCKKMRLEPFRASQTYYPGLVIADIQRQIRESRVVVAEITPVNANVYYEVGYADAIGKPVILIADGGKLENLPFDVRSFRTIFYENTIGGKNRVEKTLTEFLKNIMASK